MCAEGVAVAALGRELEILPCVTYGYLREVGAVRLDGPVQVEHAGALQGLAENLVPQRVEYLHVDGRAGALRVREHAVVDAHVPDGIPDGMEADGFVLEEGEFALVVGGGRPALFEEAYRDALERFALLVGNAARHGVGGSEPAKSENARRRKKTARDNTHLYSFFALIHLRSTP